MSELPELVGLDHVAIATIDQSHPLLALLGWPRLLSASMPSGVLVAKYGIPGSQIEIVIPEGPNTPIDRFIEQNGQGLHHIALTARGDIANAWAALSSSGFQPSPIQTSADGRPSLFLHPRGCGGVLVEIVEEDR